MNRKANLGFAAVLFAVIILVASVILVSKLDPSLTGAAAYDPKDYIPDECYINENKCVDLSGDGIIDGDDEDIFAYILNPDNTDYNEAPYTDMADFNGDGVVDNEFDFQLCFVPLRDWYLDTQDGQVPCNRPAIDDFGADDFEGCKEGCPDLNGDGIVNGSDHAIMNLIMNGSIGINLYPHADLDGDDDVGTLDSDCLALYSGRVVTCNMPRHFQHTQLCPDLRDSNGIGNDGIVNDTDKDLFEQYWSQKKVSKIDFNGDGRVNWIDRMIFYSYYDHNYVIDCDIYHAAWHTGGINKQNIAYESGNKATFGGSYNLSQSFEAGYTGQLTKIRLHLKNTTSNVQPVVVDLHEENTSSGSVNETYIIATTSLTPSFELNRSSWVTIPFQNPPVVEEGKKYHLVVSSPQSGDNDYFWYMNDVSETDRSGYSYLIDGNNSASTGHTVMLSDIDNDGFDDFIIGSPASSSAEFSEGFVSIVYGNDGGSGAFDFGDTESNFYGANTGDELGVSLATGDINGDGYEDLIVSSQGWNSDAGAVNVVYGPIEAETYKNISSTSSYTRWKGSSSSEAGYAVESGDFNADGYDDILIGAPGYNSNAGAVYVIYGPRYGDHFLEADADVKIFAEKTASLLGRSLAVGDINGDKVDDILIGASHYDRDGESTGDNAGKVYVFYSHLPDEDEINVSEADAYFEAKEGAEYVGKSLESGDINNDGFDEIIFGSQADYGSNSHGRLYVIHGSSFLEGEVSEDASFVNENLGDYLGNSISVGDLDNDNFDDIIVSAPYHNSTYSNEGAVYTLYGPIKKELNQNIGLVWNAKKTGGTASTTFAIEPESLGIGFFDGDNYGDIVIGRNMADGMGGKAYLYKGPFPINTSGSAWEQNSSGWFQFSDSEFLFQVWLSAACADLNSDGFVDDDDDGLISPIPDQLRYSGTPGWNPKFDLDGDGRITTSDSGVYESPNNYYSTNPQIEIKEVASCKNGSSTSSLAFGNNISLAQPFRADVDHIYYAGLYLKLENGSGTRDIEVLILDPDANASSIVASGVLEPVTESTFPGVDSPYIVKFDEHHNVVPGGQYLLFVSSSYSAKQDSYAWQVCGASATNDQKVMIGETNSTGYVEYSYPVSDYNMSFIIYEGNNASINDTLDVNNDDKVNYDDWNLVSGAEGEWSGETWSSKVDFNAEFGVYEELKDYTLGFKAYLNKVATCSLPNWPVSVGNGRCDSYAPYYETFENAPEDCPACNFDGFCASSEDFTYCEDCLWPAEIPHYTSFGCGTTEFFAVDNISVVENAVIEKCGYGKIEMLETADFTGLSLDNDISFSHGFLEIISPSIDALDKKANIYLYGLPYTYPLVLHDGEICEESKCIFLSYENNTDIKFNVTSLGTYNEWDIETIYDEEPFSTSIAVDDFDKPHIVSVINSEIIYMKWDGLQWTNTSLGSASGIISTVLDSKNQPHITYTDSSLGGGVKYSRLLGSSWQTEKPVSSGSYSSIDLDSDDFASFSYVLGVGSYLGYAEYNGSDWTIITLDNGVDLNTQTSLKIDLNNNVHIVYYDSILSSIKYANCTSDCTNSLNWDKITIDSTVGSSSWPSLALTNSGKPRIAYRNQSSNNLVYASCDSNCNIPANWNFETADNSTQVSFYISLALDSNDNPHISYYRDDNLYYAYKEGSNWSIEIVDSDSSVGRYNSIALDKYDNVYISYEDDGNSLLKTAKLISKTNYSVIEAAPDISDYTGSSTTNLSINNGIDLASVNNFTIENEHGMIEFLEPVDLSPVNLTRLNLSEDIQIEFNNISINIERLPQLSRKARLTLYNLKMLYPNVLRNSFDCPDEQCSFISYDDSDGTLVFEVESFSSYSAQDLGKRYVSPFLAFSLSVLSFFIIMILLDITERK